MNKVSPNQNVGNNDKSNPKLSSQRILTWDVQPN
jgi:hypothetical protein